MIKFILEMGFDLNSGVRGAGGGSLGMTNINNANVFHFISYGVVE
jgi:hypothetical protein